MKDDGQAHYRLHSVGISREDLAKAKEAYEVVRVNFFDGKAVLKKYTGGPLISPPFLDGIWKMGCAGLFRGAVAVEGGGKGSLMLAVVKRAFKMRNLPTPSIFLGFWGATENGARASRSPACVRADGRPSALVMAHAHQNPPSQPPRIHRHRPAHPQ